MGKRVRKLVLSIALMGALIIPGQMAFASELSNSAVIKDADSSTGASLQRSKHSRNLD